MRERARPYNRGMRVLLVEDYEPLARSLVQGLGEAGYAVDHAGDGEQAAALLAATPYDGLVLDLMIPKLDGLSLLAQLRRRKSEVAVLVLTARDQLADRVAGLDAGADDYLVKPFELPELLARLRAIIRRRYRTGESVIQIGELRVDTAARAVSVAGQTLTLSAREYALLEYLAFRRGQVVTRGEIWEHVYDFAAEPSSNVVDVYVGYLRKKIDHGRDAKLIHTHRGLGYSLSDEP
jgi:DNA-binding response OmpR family regulator